MRSICKYNKSFLNDILFYIIKYSYHYIYYETNNHRQVQNKRNTKLSVSHNSNKIIIIASDKRHTTYGTSCKSIHRNRQDNSGIFCNSVNESAKLIKSITNGNNMVVISPCHMEKAGLIQFCYDKPVCKPKRY